MNNKSDLRSIRTQKYLRKALFDLVGEKSIRDITVKELTERAEVSRSTFYLYYDSIQNMVQSISDESCAAYNENARRILDMGLDFKKSCIELIRHPFANEDDLNTFVELVHSGIVTWPMVTAVIYSIKDEFLRTFTVSGDEWALDYTFHFIASGIAETMMKWVHDTTQSRSYIEVAELIIGILFCSDDRLSGIRRR